MCDRKKRARLIFMYLLLVAGCYSGPANQGPSGGGGQLELETLSVFSQELVTSTGTRLHLADKHRRKAIELWAQCEVSVVDFTGLAASGVNLQGERPNGTSISLADTFHSAVNDNWVVIVNHKEFGANPPPQGKGTNAFTTFQIDTGDPFEEAIGVTFVNNTPQQNMSVITFDQVLSNPPQDQTLAHEIGHVLGLPGREDLAASDSLLMYELYVDQGSVIPLDDCITAQEKGRDYGFFN